MNPGQLFNQTSYVTFSLFLFFIATLIVLIRFRRTKIAWSGLGLLAVVFIAGDLFLRVGVSDIASTSQFDQILALRQPVVVEFYSNY